MGPGRPCGMPRLSGARAPGSFRLWGAQTASVRPSKLSRRMSLTPSLRPISRPPSSASGPQRVTQEPPSPPYCMGTPARACGAYTGMRRGAEPSTDAPAWVRPRQLNASGAAAALGLAAAYAAGLPPAQWLKSQTQHKTLILGRHRPNPVNGCPKPTRGRVVRADHQC